MRRAGPHVVGILGWPLDHTLSPILHNAAFRRLGIDWVYVSWPVPPELLEDAVRGLRVLGAMGANVTMPHKGGVVELVDELSGDARRAGVVNTIQRIGEQLVGHNTDIDGFREFLVGDTGVDPSGSTALVLGAGGAARAVVTALGDLGASEIFVTARDPHKATGITDEFAPFASVHSWERAAALAPGADVVVNTTPVGWKGEDVLPDVAWKPGQVVVDLVYDPPSTVMVERARAAGADAWGGLGMLVHQAAASLRIWTGQDPPLETMSAAALHAIGGRLKQ
jgi:shikimate dehydrogenase